MQTSGSGAPPASRRSRAVRGLALLSVAFLVFWTPRLAILQPGSREPPPAHAQTGALPPAPAQLADEALEIGRPVERELLPGNTRSFRLGLDAGRYARIAIECRGAEPDVILQGAGGETLATLKCRHDGTAFLSLVSRTVNALALTLRTQSVHAAPASCRVEIIELRPALPQDADRLVADRAVADAVRLRAQETEASNRRAIEQYASARLAWQAAGDAREEAAALRAIADVHQVLGESQEAAASYERALSIGRAAADARGEGETLAALAYLQFSLGDTGRALKNASAALASSRTAGNRRGEARALSALGEAHFALGDMARATGIQEQALVLWRELGDIRGEAQALTHLAYAYAPLGESGKAQAACRRALSLWRTVGSARGEALTLTALGGIQQKLGEKQEALNSYLTASDLLRPTGDRASTAVVLANIAVAYRGLGENRRALDYYGRALALFQATGDRWGAAETQLDLGRVHYRLGNAETALAHFALALAAFHELRMPRLEAQALRDIGLAHDARGNGEQALDHYRQALQLIRAGQDQREAAYTLNYIGRLHNGHGRGREALDDYRQALALARASGDRFAESLTFYNMADAQRGLGELTEARETIELALRIVEALRTGVASQELRATYFASVRQYYDLLIDLLMTLHRRHPSEGFDADAVAASERARARSLIDLLAEARADVRQGVDPALLQRERSLQQRTDSVAERQARLLNRPHTAADAASVERELAALTADYEEAQNQIRARSPRYAALTQVLPIGIREMQALLDDRTVLLDVRAGRRAQLRLRRDPHHAHRPRAPRAPDDRGRGPPRARRSACATATAWRERPGSRGPGEAGGRRVLAACCGAERHGAGAGRGRDPRQAPAHRGRGGAPVAFPSRPCRLPARRGVPPAARHQERRSRSWSSTKLSACRPDQRSQSCGVR